ncbi:D-alanine--D-alanine ligase family protein [Amnibacterium endophyticum]|uniref:D-alanine--D-alanine ligase n=1 Tax=Amnibacterium endophyticum TaxID=2109337 RepID=A0ABW4LGW2_9MICO
MAVVGGGANPEHEVALRGAAAVSAALAEAGHDPVPLTIGRDGVWHDAAGPLGDSPAASLATALGLLAGCDAAFPVLHGTRGEDGSAAALLDLAGVPAVGCGVRAGAIAMDKHATKALARSLGIGVVEAALVLPGAPVPQVALPAVVKPTTAGSSFGVALVERAADLPGAVAAAAALGDAVLVERYVRAREVHVAVLQRPDGTLLVPPVLEFAKPDGVLFDTSRKYETGVVPLLPAPLADGLRPRLEAAALALFRALGCAGLSRFDFFLTDDGFLLNEVNTMPGMTAQSGFPMMCAAAGLPYPALVAELVETALAATPAASGAALSR